MQATPSLDFIPRAPKELNGFAMMLQKSWRNLTTLINNKIGFGDGTLHDNIDGVWANVVAPAAPNTDFTITHNLGRIPVGYLPMQKDRACDVYTGSVAATSSQLTLRATVASAVLRLFIIGLVLALFGFGAQAQTTNLTLQVTDAGSQSWNNGTWSATLQSPPGASNFGPPFNQIGTSTLVPNQSQSGSLSATGSATATFWQNVSITPGQSQWKFSVCPQGTGVCFSQFVTITSTTSLTLTPPAISVNCGSGVTAYVNAEVGCGIGGSYYNLVSQSIQMCQAAAGNSCTTWGSGSSSPSSLAIGKFNTATFGSVGDAITLSGCTSTSGSKIITCPSAVFTSADVTKITAGNGNSLLTGTSNPIASVQSATQVTLTNNANASAVGNLFFSYGTNNVTAFAAAATASSALGGTLTTGSTFGTAIATVSIPCGRYMIEPTSATTPLMNFTAAVASGAQALVEGCDGSGTEILAGEGWVFNVAAGGTLLGSTTPNNVNVAARGFTVNGLNITFPGNITSNVLNVNGGGNIPSSSSEFIEVTNFTFTAGSPSLNMINCANCIIRQSSAHDDTNAVGFAFSGDVITYGLFGNNLGVGYHLAGVTSARFLYDSIDACTQLSGLNACMEIDGTSNNVRIIGSDFVVGASTNGLDVNITSGNRVTLIGNRFICGAGTGVGIRHISGDVHLLEQEPICGGATGNAALLNGVNANLFDDGGNTWTNSATLINVLSGKYIGGYSTSFNCAVNSASPAACGFAASGVFAIPTTTTSYTINTIAVTANSRIFLEDLTDNTGIPSAPTCTSVTGFGLAQITSRVAGTSFTISLPSTAGTTCFNYWIVN